MNWAHHWPRSNWPVDRIAEANWQTSLNCAEDAALIRDQADRCRDILRNMGRAGKDDLHLRQAPLDAVVPEAAEPHMHRGKDVHAGSSQLSGNRRIQPLIMRKPEVVHGLRNLIQNAVDFADDNVWVETMLDRRAQISVRIMDDGRGYPPICSGALVTRLCAAVRHRHPDESRPEYEGMGLGLFIAKTLLERSGAVLRFANGPDATGNTGAVVEVIWPRDKLESPDAAGRGALSQNQQIAS